MTSSADRDLRINPFAVHRRECRPLSDATRGMPLPSSLHELTNELASHPAPGASRHMLRSSLSRPAAGDVQWQAIGVTIGGGGEGGDGVGGLRETIGWGGAGDGLEHRGHDNVGGELMGESDGERRGRRVISSSGASGGCPYSVPAVSGSDTCERWRWMEMAMSQSASMSVDLFHEEDAALARLVRCIPHSTPTHPPTHTHTHTH